jgi:hypothetical protein
MLNGTLPGRPREDFAVTVREGTLRSGGVMLLLGIVLLVIGFVTGISVLWTIGLILAAIGAVLWILGSMGRPVGGRRHYW